MGTKDMSQNIINISWHDLSFNVIRLIGTERLSQSFSFKVTIETDSVETIHANLSQVVRLTFNSIDGFYREISASLFSCTHLGQFSNKQ